MRDSDLLQKQYDALVVSSRDEKHALQKRVLELEGRLARSLGHPEPVDAEKSKASKKSSKKSK